MSDVKQIGVVGNAIHTSQLPEANAFTYGEGNRFYTLENAQDGYISGHTYRTLLSGGVYSWIDVDDYGATDTEGTAIVNFLARSYRGDVIDKNGIVKTLYAGEFIGSPVEKVYLPNCTQIGQSQKISYSDIREYGYTFANCYNLKEVYLPNLSSAYTGEFYRCSSLVSVDLGALKSIGASFFMGDYSLEYVNAPQVTYIGTWAFSDCTKLKELNTGGISYVGKSALCYSPYLKSINFASDQNIVLSEYALYGIRLESIYISTTGTLMLSSSAFTACRASIIDITASSFTFYGAGHFLGCNSLSNVRLTRTDGNGITIAQNMFGSCSKLKWGDLSSANITAIAAGAFLYCSVLDYAYAPNLKYFTGSYCFSNCSRLSYVYAPMLSGIYSNASRIFYNASMLKSFYIMQESGLTEADVPYASNTGFMAYAGTSVGSTKIYVGYEEYLPWLQSATNWATYSSLMSVSLFVNPDETT